MMEKKVRLSRQDAKAQRKTQAEKSRGRRVMPASHGFLTKNGKRKTKNGS
jgi:hypothetical protein